MASTSKVRASGKGNKGTPVGKGGPAAAGKGNGSAGKGGSGTKGPAKISVEARIDLNKAARREGMKGSKGVLAPKAQKADANPAKPKSSGGGNAPANGTPKGGGPRIATAEFAAGAAAQKQIPAPKGPEIAFAGRSNVGKSSLLNMMLARKGLARTSRTPGCTRQINFFDVGVVSGPSLVFVDLPGYGYAKVSKSEARDWKILLEGYLQERPSLAAVVILVDVRRGLEQEELDLVEFLETRPGLPVLLVATKLDKLPRSAHKPRLAELARDSGVRVVGTSAETGDGREELWKRLLGFTLAPDGTVKVVGSASAEPTDGDLV